MNLYKTRSEKMIDIDITTFPTLSQLGGSRTGKPDYDHYNTISRIATQRVEIHQLLLISIILTRKRYSVPFIAFATSAT